MGEPTKAADGHDALRQTAKSRRNPFVQLAPGPEAADSRDKAGARRGMALALLGGGLFWTAVGVAALYFLRR